MKVFILATCRKPELLRMATLVFETIRIGFPTASLHVYINQTDKDSTLTIEAQCERVGASVAHCDTIHHLWIESLVMTETEPFIICDTDIVFYEKVEDWQFATPLAGALSPEWVDAKGTVHRSRLHGSFLFIDPAPIKAFLFLKDYLNPTALAPFMPPANPFHPVVVPHGKTLFFYDTCSVLYHLIGGTQFTAKQKDAFFHFAFGTIPDLCLPLLDGQYEIEDRRNWVLEDTSRGKGLWREQEEYYAAHQYVKNGKSVIATIDSEDAKEARKWCVALCCGNQQAMTLCDLWYQYCHGIDDLVDTMVDGRPSMSKEEMISLFFSAALFYNDPFYRAHSTVLFPIILQVTNTFADSVAWENSSKKHLRAMGDVFRTCGNEFYVMIALICGGEKHMRKMSMAIKERDWLGQHDKDGHPI